MTSTARFGLPTLTIALAIGVTTASAEDPTWSIEVATAIERGTYQIINDGVKLFNEGDHAGCYRLFQGALTTIGPFVKDSPDLKAAIDASLTASEQATTPTAKALELRKPLDTILEASRKRLVKKPVPIVAPAPSVAAEVKAPVNPTPTEPAMAKPVDVPPVPPVGTIALPTPNLADSAAKPDPGHPIDATLWARLGGIERMRPVVRDFLFKATNDPRVGFDRGGKYAVDELTMRKVEIHVLEFLSGETGGPLAYRGHPLREVHAGMSITKAQFKAIVEDMEDVALAHKMGKAEARELVTLLERFEAEIVSGK